MVAMIDAMLRRQRVGMFFLLLLVTPLTATRLSAAEWRQFRGPNGQAISSDTNIPTEWNDEKNVKWKLEMPGKGFSSPLVVGDNVLVTCYSSDAEGLTRHLVCVDRRRGKVAWSKAVPSKVAERGGARFGTSHGFASHTPVSDGESIFVLFGNTGVLAFDMQGKQLWQQSVGSENASTFGSAASPILYKDRLIVTAAAESESVRAFDKKTGKELWKAEGSTLSRCYSTPLVAKNAAGNDELLLSLPNEIWSLNLDTGKLNWFAETKVDLNSCPSLISDGGVVYAIGGRSGGRAAVRPCGWAARAT
jgi:outer membrane protein assembly factor BamB